MTAQRSRLLLKIIVNAKTQRLSTCNTVETLLVHQGIAQTFLPALSKQMAESGVTCMQMRCAGVAESWPSESGSGQQSSMTTICRWIECERVADENMRSPIFAPTARSI